MPLVIFMGLQVRDKVCAIYLYVMYVMFLKSE